MPFFILPQEPIESGLRRIAHEQIGIALDKFADDAVPLHEKIHSLRARCKKLRGLLRLPRPSMGDAFYIEDRNFRTAAKLLAGHRDVDVLASTIQSLGGSNQEIRAPQPPIPAAAIERSLEIMRECRNAVDDWPLDIKGFDDVAPGFLQTYQKCLDAWNKALREPSDTNFHDLRKKTKYHWYQVRILERLNRQEIHARRSKLRDLQLTLGTAHDLAVLQAFLESGEDFDVPLLQRAITRKRKLYLEAMNICGEVYTKPAEELVADYSRWWHAGGAEQ